MEFYAIYIFLFLCEKFVSIPNGMEFYPLALGSVSFISVSIPNGMELYSVLPIYSVSVAFVSIPNGMEFYKNFK